MRPAKNLNRLPKKRKRDKFAKFLEKAIKEWHVSIITLLLLVFSVQLTFGVVVNVAKVYSLHTKIAKIEKINKMANKKNQYLREELEKYTSNTGVEALARNRLQFSKEDETLIIIKDDNTLE